MSNEIVSVPIGDDEIHGICDASGQGYIIVKRTCESIGLSYERQFRKLKEADWDPGVALMAIPDARGHHQETCVIPWESFPMWMTTIATGRVRPEFRERLRVFKTQARDVLAERFAGSHPLQRDISQPVQADPIKSMLLAALETREKQLQLESDLQHLQREHLKLMCSIEAAEAKLAETEGQVCEAIKRAAEAQQDANRAVRTVTSEADCFTLVTWAESQGIKLVPPCDSIEGKRLAAICRANGVIQGRISTTRHPIGPDGKGGVKVSPVAMLRIWLVDYLKRHPLMIGGTQK